MKGLDLIRAMGQEACDQVNKTGEELLHRFSIKTGNIRKAKKAMAKGGYELIPNISKNENIVYFWWALQRNGELIAKSQTLKFTMKRIDQ